MDRKPIIMGNWKMNKTIKQAVEYIEELKAQGPFPTHAYLAVPFTALQPCADQADPTIVIGAQNLYPEPKGAFTGEVSAEMLKEAGARFVILGHSERRHIMGESSEFIRRKVFAALDAGITPVVCVGETLEEREGGKANQIIEKQVIQSLEGVGAEQISSIVIAYEPVWAIGTGKTASLNDVETMHMWIRELLYKYWQEASSKTPILYGGSVSEKNGADLLAISYVDGVLVGGASLEVQKFAILLHNVKTTPVS